MPGFTHSTDLYFTSTKSLFAQSLATFKYST